MIMGIRKLAPFFFSFKIASFQKSVSNLESFLQEHSTSNDESRRGEIDRDEGGEGHNDKNNDKQETSDNEDDDTE